MTPASPTRLSSDLSWPERSGVRRLLPSGGLGRSFCGERPLRLGRRGGRLRRRDLRRLYLPDLALQVGFTQACADIGEQFLTSIVGKPFFEFQPDRRTAKIALGDRKSTRLNSSH